TENKIGAQVKAYIDGDGTTGLEGNHVTLTAHDESIIRADAESVTLAISFAAGGSGAISIGTTLSTNTIDNTVEASVKNADTKVQSRTGDLNISASETASITASAAAAAASFSISPASFALSAAGANSTNTITTHVAAFIQNSTNATAPVQASGAVHVTATDTPTIDATIVAVSLSASLIGASLAVSL